MRRTGLGLMVLLVAGLLVLPALSQSKPPQPAQGGSVSGESAGTQARLQREFQEFKLALKLLEQRLEKSGKPDDKLRVASIREALKLIEEKSTDSKFENILQDLRKQELFKSTDKLQGLVDRNKDLAEDLARLIDALNRDPEAELRRQREEAKKVLEKLKDVIGKQERVRGNTEQGRMSKEELEKAQAKVTQETRELKNLIEGKKSSSKDGDPKDGKGKDGMGKDGKGKDGDPKDGKGKDGKDGMGKDGDPKDGKGKDGKDGMGKDGKGKDGDPKDGKGKDGKDGMGKDGQSQDGMNKDSGGDESADSSQQPLPQEKDQARKRIQEATEFQKESEKKIAKDEKKAASEKQGDALDKLKEAQKKLEELLKQLREEEIDRVLVQLQARCVEMLRLQMEVRAGTAELQASVMARPDKKPDRVHEQKALEWHDREAQIVRKAADALRLIESEGSAVAFAEVFRQVGDDMSNVRDRLKLADVGEETVRIEDDIIATLREMIESLKKAQQDNKNKKPPMPGQPGQQNPGQQDQRLIDQISELKMIRSMQLQINKRTESYGRKFEGEQAPDPSAVPDARSKAQAEQVLKEIRDLGRRQDKIGKVARDISLGRNKGQ
ncbi:MAG: hypothetical protein KJS91_04710 [Planctomycetes bacterium]|nr:hypothetical protein [Planctomycetota bacterium]